MRPPADTPAGSALAMTTAAGRDVAHAWPLRRRMGRRMLLVRLDQPRPHQPGSRRRPAPAPPPDTPRRRQTRRTPTATARRTSKRSGSGSSNGAGAPGRRSCTGRSESPSRPHAAADGAQGRSGRPTRLPGHRPGSWRSAGTRRRRGTVGRQISPARLTRRASGTTAPRVGRLAAQGVAHPGRLAEGGEGVEQVAGVGSARLGLPHLAGSKAGHHFLLGERHTMTLPPYVSPHDGLPPTPAGREPSKEPTSGTPENGFLAPAVGLEDRQPEPRANAGRRSA